MLILRKLLKATLFFFAIPVVYLLVSLLLTAITVNNSQKESSAEKVIYISTNGVHLDIIIPVSQVSDALKEGLNFKDETYLAFGWGDENFYLNTPTWSDLTFNNAFAALFLNSTALIHLTRYTEKRSKWVEVPLNNEQLKLLNTYLSKVFMLDRNGGKIILNNRGYTLRDDFYRANGSYSCFKTCNSWVNSALKASDLKSCYWTPFDFGVINKYKD